VDKNKKNELKVGIVSILGIAILISAIMILKGVNFIEKSIPVLFIFDNSLGITDGSPIVVNGVKRGNIEKVYNKDGKVYIEAILNEVSDLKSDVSAVISILEITGGKKIEIFPGTEDISYNQNEPIIGRLSADLPTVIQDVGNVSENLASIIVKLDMLLTKTSNVLENDDLANDLQSIIKNTATVTEEMSALIKKNNQNINSSISDLTHILADLRATVNTKKPQIEVIIDNLEIASKDLNKLLAQTDNTFAGIDKLISDVNEIVTEIKSNNKGAINKLIYDKEFADKLDSLVQSFDGLAKQIKEYGINANVRLGGRP
jgi:phospholipid/cholesterol/gamma-HCH transport system substrate-binding protein